MRISSMMAGLWGRAERLRLTAVHLKFQALQAPECPSPWRPRVMSMGK